MLRGVNLNLLPILRELLRERNVTAAAKRLNLTQSGVSEALGRLRVQFGDELLVKTGRRMVPTALALEIAPRLEDLLATTEDLLRPVRFNPAYSDREIRIATGDTVALALGKGLLQRLAAQAPRTTIQFVSTEAPMRANLEEGKIDFLIIFSLTLQNYHHNFYILIPKPIYKYFGFISIEMFIKAKSLFLSYAKKRAAGNY
jgi:DNA-binding transcriptional LysR family regulator